jgi:hypothetical protein
MLQHHILEQIVHPNPQIHLGLCLRLKWQYQHRFGPLLLAFLSVWEGKKYLRKEEKDY